MSATMFGPFCTSATAETSIPRKHLFLNGTTPGPISATDHSGLIQVIDQTRAKCLAATSDMSTPFISQDGMLTMRSGWVRLNRAIESAFKNVKYVDPPNFGSKEPVVSRVKDILDSSYLASIHILSKYAFVAEENAVYEDMPYSQHLLLVWRAIEKHYEVEMKYNPGVLDLKPSRPEKSFSEPPTWSSAHRFPAFGANLNRDAPRVSPFSPAAHRESSFGHGAPFSEMGLSMPVQTLCEILPVVAGTFRECLVRTQSTIKATPGMEKPFDEIASILRDFDAVRAKIYMLSISSTNAAETSRCTKPGVWGETNEPPST